MALYDVPSMMCRSYTAVVSGELSSSERYLVGLAAALRSGAIIDEFVTALPHAMRLEVAAAVGAFIRARGLRGVVLASCHGRDRQNMNTPPCCSLYADILGRRC